MSHDGLRESKWQMKPGRPEGRLVLGTGSGDVSNSLDSAVGLAVRGNGIGAGVFAGSIF